MDVLIEWLLEWAVFLLLVGVGAMLIRDKIRFKPDGKDKDG